MLQIRFWKFFKNPFKSVLLRIFMGLTLAGVFGFQAIQGPVHTVYHLAEGQDQRDSHHSGSLQSSFDCSICLLGQVRSEMVNVVISLNFTWIITALLADRVAQGIAASDRVAQARGPPIEPLAV